MKIEIGEKRPKCYKEYWEGVYDIFSHYESIANVPHSLFLITTLKENGKANACLHSWSAFSGDAGGFFAILSGLLMNSHTYGNILREKEFCVNFLDHTYYDACIKTIKNNSDEEDEISIAGFTAEKSSLVKAPRIKEAFLSFECNLHSNTDLSGKGISSMIIGRVVNAAIEGEHDEADKLCGEKGFMYYVSAPKNPATGDGAEFGAISILKPMRPE